MTKLEKMPPDTWLKELENWTNQAEESLQLLKKEYARQTKLQEHTTQINQSQHPQQNTQASTPQTISHQKTNTPTVTVTLSHGTPQFFTRQKQNGKYKKIYIHKTDTVKVKKQLQQKYLQTTIEKLETNIKQIKQFLLQYNKNRAWTYFDTLSQAKQKVIIPSFLPTPQYIEKWQTDPYTPKQITQDTPLHYTNKKEQVRSKSEVIIADTLDAMQIPYKYEKPLNLDTLTVYPDFCCLNTRTRQEIYWEHLGMLDDQTYISYATRKFYEYQKHGYFIGQEIIITFETKEIPFNKEIAKQMIEKYLL